MQFLLKISLIKSFNFIIKIEVPLLFLLTFKLKMSCRISSKKVSVNRQLRSLLGVEAQYFFSWIYKLRESNSTVSHLHSS